VYFFGRKNGDFRFALIGCFTSALPKDAGSLKPRGFFLKDEYCVHPFFEIHEKHKMKVTVE